MADWNVFEKNKKILLTNPDKMSIINIVIRTKTTKYADVAHLVERHLAKVEVASSSLVIRSRKKDFTFVKSFFCEINP